MTNEFPDFPLTCGRFIGVYGDGAVRTLAVYRFRMLCGRRQEHFFGQAEWTSQNACKEGFHETKSSRVFGQRRNPPEMFRVALYARVYTDDQTFTMQYAIVEAAIQVAPRPRKGMIPPE